MNTYKCLSKNIYTLKNIKIVPIRYEDRFTIMKWRNEQIFHLRQDKPLTADDQENYFSNVISALFNNTHPSQLLFSYLENNNNCIGYGGLVHINWKDKNAEISFLMNTDLQDEGFSKHWSIFIALIQQVAFHDLKLHKIYTYAFDIRPDLYPVLEGEGFQKEAVLKDHCLINNEWKDVIIHALFYPEINVRKVGWEDTNHILTWANDPITRENSFNNRIISKEEHETWLTLKMNDPNAGLYICTVNNNPAAFVRFDKKNDFHIIGINVNPYYRGKHLAAGFIKKSLETIPENQVIVAYIKPQNLASVRTFEKAGFTFCGTQKVNETEALVYQYKTNG
jgi:RimJ/RimL family protein N-acetyltransferase